MSKESLSKKFISDEEIQDMQTDKSGPFTEVGLLKVRACIDKALKKAGVTELGVPGSVHIGKRSYTFAGDGESGFPLDPPLPDWPRAILYIQPAKPKRTVEERTKKALAVFDKAGPNANGPHLSWCQCWPCVAAEMAAALRGDEK